MAVMQDEARRVEPVHQGVIVGGDDHRGAEPVQLDEQPQQPVGDDRIDIAGRLVGEQQFGPADDGAGDGGALLLAAGQHLGIGMDAVAEPDPAEQVGDVLAVVGLPSCP